MPANDRATEIRFEIAESLEAQKTLGTLQSRAEALPGLEREQRLLERQAKAADQMAETQDAVKATVDQAKSLLADWHFDFAKVVYELASLCEKLVPIEGSLYAARGELDNAVSLERGALGDLDNAKTKDLGNASLEMARRYGELATSLGLFDETLAPYVPATDPNLRVLAQSLMQIICGKVRVYDPSMVKTAGFR